MKILLTLLLALCLVITAYAGDKIRAESIIGVAVESTVLMHGFPMIYNSNANTHEKKLDYAACMQGELIRKHNTESAKIGVSITQAQFDNWLTVWFRPRMNGIAHALHNQKTALCANPDWTIVLATHYPDYVVSYPVDAPAESPATRLNFLKVLQCFLEDPANGVSMDNWENAMSELSTYYTTEKDCANWTPNLDGGFSQ